MSATEQQEMPPARGLGASLRKRVRRELMRQTHLVERVVAGPLTPQVRTFSETVFMWENATLKRYLSREPRRYETPVLIIPPLMANPVIFDLRPGHSMVHHFLDAGYDTYMLDFGNPGEDQKDITVEDYVTDFIPNGVQKLLEVTGAESITLVGWSMGGIMSMIYTALYGENSGVKNAIVLGSPFDFSAMVPFASLAGLVINPLRAVIGQLGNVPGELTRAGFMAMAPLGTLTRYWALWKKYHDREFVAAWETMGEFINAFFDYPQEAFLQFLTDFIRDDKLRQNKLVMGEKTVRLADVKANILLFVGTGDKVASPESVQALAELVSSHDMTVNYVPVGHIGLVEGSKAPSMVWAPMVDWLAERS